MSKKNIFNKNFTLSIGKSMIMKARQNTHARILKDREKGKFINEEREHQIYNQELNKVKLEFGFKSTLAAIGLSALVIGGPKLLSSPSEHSSTKTEFSIDSNNKESKQESSRERFVQELSVDGITGWEAIPTFDSENQQKINKNIDKVSNQELENTNSDFVIQSFIDSYNEEMGTDLKIEDLKYLQTSDSKYLYPNEFGDYIFDYTKNGILPSGQVSSCDIVSIIDANSNHIIYSSGKIKTSPESEPKYSTIDVRHVDFRQNEGFSSSFKEGEYFRSDNIFIDEDLKGNRSIEQTMYDAISNEVKRVIEERENKTKAQDSERDI